MYSYKSNTYLHKKHIARIFLIVGIVLSSFSGFSQTENQTKTIAPINDTIAKDSIRVAKNAIEFPVVYSASDSTIFSTDGEQKVYLYGEAKVTYGELELTAAFIEFDASNNVVFAKWMPDSTGHKSGLPVLKQGKDTYEGEEMHYNFKNKKGIIKNVVTEQSGGFLHSEITKKHEDGSIHLQSGRYTTCDLEHPHYYVALTRAKALPNDKIVSGPLYFVIADIPIPIFLPFGYFPDQSKHTSGILIPSYGEENNRGFYLRDGGYYWHINDYLSVQVVGEGYTEGSWGLNAKTDYRWRYKMGGSFDVKYSKVVSGEKGSPNYVSQNTFWVKWTHTQDPKSMPNSSFSANVNLGSSSYQKYNALTTTNYNSNDYLSNTFGSSVSFSKRWPGKPFNFSANLRHSQNTSTKMVNLTLPSVSFNMSRLYPFKFKKSMGDKWYEKIELRVSSEMQNTITAPDSLLFTPQAHWRNGLRYDIPFGATMKLAKKGFFRHFSLSPSFDYTGRLYTNYVEKAYRDVMVYDTNTSEGRLVTDTLVIDTTQAIRHAFMVSPSVSLSFSPRLYGSYAFKNPNNHALKVVRHVMNLSMSANFKPRFGDDSKYYRTLYDTTGREQERYFIYQDGYSLSQTSDRSAGISFNLSNNLEAKIKQRNDTTDDEPKKVKLIDNLSVSTSYNVFADSLNLMPISISARTRIIKNMVDITTNARFDPYSVDYKGRTINKLEFAKNHRLARFNNMYTSMSLTLSPEAFKKDTKDQKDKKEVVPIVYSPEAIPYITFNVPWSVSVNYTLQYLQVANSYDPLKDKFDYKIQQSINFSGNFELTPKWKFGFTSGYEFTSGEFTYTSANLYRDLHCFEMAINWVPFGARQSYNFRINIKSSIFKGLEYKKKKSMFDYM